MGAGPVFKRHGDKGKPVAVTKKMLRCNQISAPVLVNMTIHTSCRHMSDSQTCMDFTFNIIILFPPPLTAPLQVIGTPAVGDFDCDGRLDVAYSAVWSSITPDGEDTTPELKVFAFTLEERYTIVDPGGSETVVNFESFLPADQQPWNRYMGRHGNNVYYRGG